MLKIKLSRFGKRGQPHYRIVIAEAKSKRDGKYVESIGHYAPVQHPKLLEIDVDKYQAWVKKGAQPTETVAALFKRYQSGEPFPAKKAKLSKKAKAKLAAEKEAKAEVKKAPEKEPPEKEKAADEQPAGKPAKKTAEPEVEVEAPETPAK